MKITERQLRRIIREALATRRPQFVTEIANTPANWFVRGEQHGIFGISYEQFARRWEKIKEDHGREAGRAYLQGFDKGVTEKAEDPDAMRSLQKMRSPGRGPWGRGFPNVTQ